jgi:hypothetical protein
MIAIKLAAATALLSACSFGMTGLDPKWDGKSQPDCSDAAIVLDRAVGAAFLATGVGTIWARQDDAHVLAGGIAIGVGAIFQISASVGSKTFITCQTARTRWAFGNTIQARTAERASAGRAALVPQPAPDQASRPWAAGVSAAAQATALRLYTAGNQEFVQAHYPQALVKYKEAIRYWDHPGIRFNMAVCLINLDDPVEARDNLERSLRYGEAALDASTHAQGLAYRKLLDDKLVRLRIDCPEPDEEVMLDGKLLFKGPGMVDRFLLPGEHQIVATKPGFLAASKKIILVAGQPALYEIRPLVDPRPTVAPPPAGPPRR